MGDQPLGRIGEEQADLLPQVIGERGARGDILVDIGRSAALAADGPRPVGAEAILAALLGKNVVDFGVVGAGDGIGGLRTIDGGGAVVERADLDGRLGGLGRLTAVLALEERVAQQFGFDEGVELEMAELQQADRLHELRRERQRLRLPGFEPRREGHTSCFPAPRKVRRAATMDYSHGEGKKRARLNSEWARSERDRCGTSRIDIPGPTTRCFAARSSPSHREAVAQIDAAGFGVGGDHFGACPGSSPGRHG